MPLFPTTDLVYERLFVQDEDGVCELPFINYWDWGLGLPCMLAKVTPTCLYPLMFVVQQVAFVSSVLQQALVLVYEHFGSLVNVWSAFNLYITPRNSSVCLTLQSELYYQHC